jgi:tripeptide aminopeptidase
MEKIEDLFIKLVKIDSPPGSEKNLGDFVIRELNKLNLDIKKDKFGNIVVRSKAFNKNKSILISAHLDTIGSTKEIKPIIKKGIIYSNGKHILGADNKAAIAEIIYTLKKIKTLSNVELLFTVQEEAGLIGAKNLDKGLIESKRALVLDYSFPPGHIVLKTPYAIILEVEISGETVHGARANLNHNVIGVSSSCISSTTSDIASTDINYNIGEIGSDGLGVNAAPSRVIFKSSFRSFSYDELKNFLEKNKKHLEEIAKKRHCDISFKETSVGLGYSYNRSDEFIKTIINNFKKINIEASLEESTGLSDANILNSYGIKAIEIGYGPKNVHTNKEQVSIKDMNIMSDFLIEMIKK